jgi:16S rRNA (uracil1498-N3)-methyltransferase
MNGQGVTAQAEIIHAHDKRTQVNVLAITHHKPHNAHFHLAVAPNKSADRFEWLLEKITELGTAEFTPIISARTIRDKIRMDRMQKIVLSAAKQSMNPWHPKLNEPIDFERFIKKNESIPLKMIAHCLKEQKETFKNVIEHSDSKNCICLIGPEGDFNPREIQIALSGGFKAVSLGEQRLRTETAAIFAAASFKLMSGY